MGETRWTEAQSRAIAYEGENLLLSAAAGSGKTATLTERIVSLLTAPDSEAEISRILAVTFTRAAAAELKERVGKALREAIRNEGASRRLERQLCDLGRAQITTIHAFCLHTLRPHFAELSLPAGFSVASAAEIGAMSAEIMADTVSDFFEEGAEDFLALADTLGGARDDSLLDRELLDLSRALVSRGLDGSDLARLAESLSGMTGFFSSAAGAGSRVRVTRFAAHYCACLSDFCAELSADELLALKYYPAAKADFDLASSLLAAANRGDYDGCRAALMAYTPLKLGVVRAEKQTEAGLFFKKLHSDFKDEVKKLRARSFTLTEAETADTVKRTAYVAKAAARVLSEYFRRLGERKRERGVVDFGDLETMTARLLMDKDGTPTACARDIAKAYDYIFIDEYQDTNEMQDTIFRAVSEGGRRFMVGDIKQSIYRFRGAEPEVFSSYRRKWQPLGEGDGQKSASLFMQENFRCDKTVVDFVNLVSRHLFSRCAIPFTKDDELVFAKSCPDGYTPHPIEICLLEKSDGAESESEYVARRISTLLAEGRRADGAPITPGDIAILLRSPGTDGEAFIRALRERGIPVQHQTSGGLFEQPEVVYVLSILRALDNPGRDIDLAGAMRGPVFGFTLDDLVRIRRTCPKGSLWDAVRTAAGELPPDDGSEGADESLRARCRAFSEDLTSLRADARGMKADELILRLYRETDIEQIAAAEEGRDPTAAVGNLRALYEEARVFEGGAGGGLYPFLMMINEAVETDSPSAETDSTDSVHVLSMHHAKGLEFPVCFVCRADKGRNRKDSTSPLLFDTTLGAVMRLPDAGGIVRCDTPLRQSLAAAITDASIEEEMRVLYVALTRARERLIVTAAVSDPDAAIGLAEVSPAVPYFSEETVFSSPSYLEWMLKAIAEARFHGEDTSYITVRRAEEREDTDSIEPSSDAEAEVPSDTDAETYRTMEREMRKRLSFSYPHAHLAAIPAKLTVSHLYPAVLDAEETPAAPPSERNAPPAFLSGKTELEAAFAGTATHVLLQFADFARLKEYGPESECARLLAAGFLSAEMADAVRMEEIRLFVGSDLFARICTARSVRREFRFNAALPAADFTMNESLAAFLRADGADIIVQGVMDLLFEDEDGRVILVDYKTDRLTKRELAEPSLAGEKLTQRYADQLSYYRAAASAMLGRDVDECLIYSLPLGDTVEIK